MEIGILQKKKKKQNKNQENAKDFTQDVCNVSEEEIYGQIS